MATSQESVPAASKGTTSAVLLALLVKVARTAGLDGEAMLRAANIDPEVLEDSSARVPRSSEHVLWSALARQTGDDAFGMHLAENWVNSGQFGVLEYLIRGSATLRAACEQVTQFLPLLFDGDEVVYETRADGAVVFGYRRGVGGPPLTRHPEECAVTAFVLLARFMLGPDWNPAEILFEHAEPKDTREHQRIFRVPVSFGQKLNGVVFSAYWLDRPWGRSDPQLQQLLQDYSSRLLATLPQGPPFTEQVRRIVAQQLPTRVISVKEAAQKLSLSVRSLQRRLDAEGRTFREVVEEVQLSSALQHFERGAQSVAEVAFKVGFNDQNAFSRAFKRMTGKSPSEVVEQLRAGSGQVDGPRG
jgi:AraC-like DNA-binding protein